MEVKRHRMREGGRETEKRGPHWSGDGEGGEDAGSYSSWPYSPAYGPTTGGGRQARRGQGR
jgi:hypothetical protein